MKFCKHNASSQRTGDSHDLIALPVPPSTRIRARLRRVLSGREISPLAAARVCVVRAFSLKVSHVLRETKQVCSNACRGASLTLRHPLSGIMPAAPQPLSGNSRLKRQWAHPASRQQPGGASCKPASWQARRLALLAEWRASRAASPSDEAREIGVYWYLFRKLCTRELLFITAGPI